jgi:CheY-like chemotaxis protein
MSESVAEGREGDVFVVDDNPANLGLLTRILRDAGFAVRVAQSGRRAIAAMLVAPPELVLLDVSMPDLDGYEVCAALRAEAATRDVPVIFLSALSDVADKLSAFRAGGQDYVTKPFQAEEVLARVRTQLLLSRGRRELQRCNDELARANQELRRAWAEADQIFAAYADMLEGTVLAGDYRLEKKIGAGGTAAVYQATHLPTGDAVAVKVTRPQPGEEQTQRRRSANEGESALRLDHPHAVRVLASGVTPGGVSYLVMELYSGGTFEDLLAAGAISVARALEVIVPVCRALAAAHALGIVHRDVKPANVVLHRDADGKETVKVVDFGIASIDDDVGTAGRTTVGRIVGTPIYLAPERILGRAYDGRVDVYAVGMMLFRAIAGRFPFAVPQSLGAVLFACVNEPAERLARVCPEGPPALDELVARLVAKSPDERPTMAELVSALETMHHGGVTLQQASPAVCPDLDTVDAPLSGSSS